MDGVDVDGVVGMVSNDNGNVLCVLVLLEIPNGVGGDGGGSSFSLASELKLDQSGQRSLASSSVAPRTTINDYSGRSLPPAYVRASSINVTLNLASVKCPCRLSSSSDI